MEVDKSIVPVFIKTDVPKEIRQIGTGVFIDFQDEPFLFTAAHVTDELVNGRLLVPTLNGLSEIEGYQAHLDLLPELSRNDDSIDMAYYRLSTSFARKMCSHFYPLVGQAEIIESSLNLGVLSVVGYPANKGKRKAKEFSSDLAYYRGVSAPKETYDELKLPPDQNIIMHFKKKNAVSPDTGKGINPPSPKGVSGGAIFAWPYGKEFSTDWSIPKLVGILHSYKEKEGLFIGTTLIPYLSATLLGQMKGYDGVF